MRFFLSLAALVLVVVAWTGMSGSNGAQPAAAKAPTKAKAKSKAAASAPVHRPYGIEIRVPWTTSKIQGTPEPPDPYTTQVAFPKLTFTEPLSMVTLPGTDRLVIAERPGKIFAFANDPATAEKQLLFDVGRTIHGIIFHPDFAANGQLFVVSIPDPEHPSPTGTQLSRFTAKKKNPIQFDPKSEVVLLKWSSEGHRGGCLEFGPDGYLYLGIGDGSGIADSDVTGQDLTDLEASILRIDVNMTQGNLPYAIPADNPFVGREGARGEVWAYGLRQPWKFSFDSSTGELWTGDVGQDLWEMVYRIEKGGNYGWSINEGNHPFRPQRPKGPSPILPPIVEHSHTDFRSITGGYVYHGKRQPDLSGAYIYGDYDTGKIWALRYAQGKVREHFELADTLLRIVDFGQDRQGEIYLVDFMGGQLHRLVKSPPVNVPAAPFPRKLSETGLFASTKDHVPAPGLIPYSVNSALWSDGAAKERFLAVPGKSQIQYNTITYPQPAPGALPGWRFPDGTVVVKTFTLEMEAGNPASARRLETRILHYEQTPGTQEVGDQVWRGYTYVWNDEQTDADLLEKNGLDRTYTIADPQAPGGKREQVWRFPSRAECSLCHTTPAKYVLGINTHQMNKDHDYGGVIANQLTTLEHLGIFTAPLPAMPEKLPRLVDYADKSQDLNLRARSYLESNCAHCHRKWGGGNAEFQLVASLPLSETGTLDTKPGQGTFDLADPRILVAGDPVRSMVLHRMQKLGLGRMPHIASNQVHREAVELIERWIRELDKPEAQKRIGMVPGE